MNGEHFEHAMFQAEIELAQVGYANVDLNVVMLVGFKYLAEKHKEHSNLRLRVDGKGWFSFAVLTGGIAGGALLNFL